MSKLEKLRVKALAQVEPKRLLAKQKEKAVLEKVEEAVERDLTQWENVIEKALLKGEETAHNIGFTVGDWKNLRHHREVSHEYCAALQERLGEPFKVIMASGGSGDYTLVHWK